MDTLGKRISHYRKERGLSQEKVAEHLMVSRQAVTKWENDKSRPSTDNLLRLAEYLNVPVSELLGHSTSKPLVIGKGPSVCCCLSILCTIAYVVSGIITGNLMAGIVICMVAISIMMQLFLHIYFVNAIRNEDFNGLGGYDSHIEYNIPELKALLIRMDQHISITSTAYVILLFISAYTNIKIVFFPDKMNGMNQLSVLLVLLYTIEFIWTIVYMNFKSQDKIYMNQIDRNRARAGYLSLVIYIILILAVTIEAFVVMHMRNIANNTGNALKMVGYILLFCIISTVGLLVEQSKIKKADLTKEKYKLSRFFITSTILSAVIMGIILISK